MPRLVPFATAALVIIAGSTMAQTSFLKSKPAPAAPPPKVVQAPVVSLPKPTSKAPTVSAASAPVVTTSKKVVTASGPKRGVDAADFAEVKFDSCGPNVMTGLPYEKGTDYCVATTHLHTGASQTAAQCAGGLCPGDRNMMAVAIYENQNGVWKKVASTPGSSLLVSKKKHHNGWQDIRIGTLCDKLDGRGPFECANDYWFDGQQYVGYSDSRPPAGSEVAIYKAPPPPPPFPDYQETQILEQVLTCKRAARNVFARAKPDLSFKDRGFTIYNLPDNTRLANVPVAKFIAVESTAYSPNSTGIIEAYAYMDASEAKKLAESLIQMQRKKGMVKWHSKAQEYTDATTLNYSLGIRSGDKYIIAAGETPSTIGYESEPLAVTIYDRGIMAIYCVQY